jgi:trehalose/maltose hydrolase-like predicted phosphorylase
VFEEYVPDEEGTREALCVLGNGRFGTRGATSMRLREADWHYPGTYAAGIYNRLSSVVEGERIDYEELVNLPSWLPVQISFGQEEVRDWQVLELRRELDLASGLLRFRTRVRDAQGRELRIEEQRWVHMSRTCLAGQLLSITSENYSGPLRVSLALDGAVGNRNADEYIGLDRKHLERIETGSDGSELTWLRARTRHSRIEVALAARQRVLSGDARVAANRTGARVALDFETTLERGRSLSLEKLVALYTSRDHACTDPLTQALHSLSPSPELSFEALERSQKHVWRRLWQGFLFELPGKHHVQTALRLNMFHILQTVSPMAAQQEAGVPARGLHGENYHGHIFWDDLFVFPVLNLRWPELTRSLLLYRYHRLGEARRAAHAAGLRGALFPWRSASDGREVTDRLRRNPNDGRYVPDHSRLQRHINATIAYSVWYYVHVSGDLEFLYSYGAELILSIAQLWASIAELGHDGRYHLRGVVGPDEFHDAYPDAEQPGIDDNTYTNVMAVWCLLRALDLFERVPSALLEPLLAQLGIGAADRTHWQELTHRIAVPVQSNGKILDQFAGFEQLAPFDWEGYRARYDNIERLDNILAAEGGSVNRYQACKQADVMMLFYLFSEAELNGMLLRLGYDLGPDAFRASFDYYRARTSNGSTLDRVVQSCILARMDRACSWAELTKALGSDLCDVQGGSTREGIHIGAMAGTIDIFQRAYLGLEIQCDRLCLSPQLPPELPELRLRIRFRMQWLLLHVTQQALQVQSEPHGDGAVTLSVNGRCYELTPGVEHKIVLGAHRS